LEEPSRSRGLYAIPITAHRATPGHDRAVEETEQDAVRQKRGEDIANVVVSTIAHAYRNVHQQLREHIAAADDAALPWAPAPETNPLSVLVVHTLGSEAEVWRLAAGVSVARDRDAEFVPRQMTKRDLLMRLDAADALLAELARRIGPEELEAIRERPERRPHTALHWLVTNYGHAREHLAHVELTLQLYRARSVEAE
jgi:hypothetical protein